MKSSLSMSRMWWEMEFQIWNLKDQLWSFLFRMLNCEDFEGFDFSIRREYVNSSRVVTLRWSIVNLESSRKALDDGWCNVKHQLLKQVFSHYAQHQPLRPEMMLNLQSFTPSSRVWRVSCLRRNGRTSADRWIARSKVLESFEVANWQSKLAN